MSVPEAGTITSSDTTTQPLGEFAWSQECVGSTRVLLEASASECGQVWRNSCTEISQKPSD